MKSVGVDFDGVIHAYSKGWQDGEIYDVPVPGALAAIDTLQNAGHPVFVFTSRDDTEAVAEWLIARGIDAVWDDGVLDPFWNDTECVLVTNRKLGAALYIDDRGYRFRDWESCLAETAEWLQP